MASDLQSAQAWSESAGDSLGGSFAAAAATALATDLQAVQAWFKSPGNSLDWRLEKVDEERKQLIVFCPPNDQSGISDVRFQLSLVQPYTVSADDASLDDLEEYSYEIATGSDASALEIMRKLHQFALDEWMDDGVSAVPLGAGEAPADQDEDDWGEDGKEDDADWGSSAADSAAAAAEEDEWAACVPAAYGSEVINLADPDPALAASAAAMDDDMPPPGEPPKLQRQVSYSVFAAEDLKNEQRSMIFRVSEKLQVSQSSAATLLLNCRWRELDCYEEWREPETREALLARSNIKHCLDGSFLNSAPDEMAVSASGAPIAVPMEDDEEEEITCQVCYDDLPVEQTFGMRCGHRLCIPCYREYLENEIMGGTAGGASCLRSACPAYKCTESVGEEVFEMLLDPETFQRYRQLQWQSFVDDAEDYCWCPKPTCGNVIGFTTRCKTVRCLCSHVFCFKCRTPAHAPTECLDAEVWRSKDGGEDVLSAQLLLKNTKPCPKCKTKTEKNGGCMYITCTQCRIGWCWHCGDMDPSHHVFECNRPQYGWDDVAATGQDKYLFYFERYFNHLQSEKITDDVVKKCQTRLEQLNAAGASYNQLQSLLRAVQLIAECRRVLKWTYVRAYFLSVQIKHVDPQKRNLLSFSGDTEADAQRTATISKNEVVKKQLNLFEFKQSELERYTELLNQLTDKAQVSLDGFDQHKQKVMDWTKALEEYLAHMEMDAV